MSKKLTDRFIGLISALIVSLLSFMTYSYFGSFETKAASETKYGRLDKKVSLVLCLMDTKYCTVKDWRLDIP